jgi:hypothetical protein
VNELNEHTGYVHWKRIRAIPAVRREAIGMAVVAFAVLALFVALCIWQVTP